MPEPVHVFLVRLRTALAEGRVLLTRKADDEVADVGWSHDDVFDQLALLEADDLLRTEPSKSYGFGMIWVFCPLVWEVDRYLWTRLSERADRTFVISFHLAEEDPWL